MTAVPVTVAPTRQASASFWHAAWYRYRRNRLALVAGVIAVAVLLVGLLAPYIAPYSDAAIDLTSVLAGATAHHLLGTDQLGRDTLTRAIWGARTSMTVAIGAPLIGVAIGLPIGIIAGWFGGIFDWVTLRLFELFQMVPTILAALLFITVFGVNVWKLAFFIGVTLWVGFGRLARAQYLALRDRDFVQSMTMRSVYVIILLGSVHILLTPELRRLYADLRASLDLPFVPSLQAAGGLSRLSALGLGRPRAGGSLPGISERGKSPGRVFGAPSWSVRDGNFPISAGYSSRRTFPTTTLFSLAA